MPLAKAVLTLETLEVLKLAPKCSNAGYYVRVWRDVSGVVGIGGAETQETAS